MSILNIVMIRFQTRYAMIRMLGMVLLAAAILVRPCPARDFIVEFEHENYKEEQKTFSYTPILYHAVQVRSGAGPKLLVLTGEDAQYRAWLRQYIAQGRAFIARVPDAQDDQFISSSVFDIDVTRVHPMDLALYNTGRENAPLPDKQLWNKGAKRKSARAGAEKKELKSDQRQAESRKNRADLKAEQDKQKRLAEQAAEQEKQQEEQQRLANYPRNH